MVRSAVLLDVELASQLSTTPTPFLKQEPLLRLMSCTGQRQPTTHARAARRLFALGDPKIFEPPKQPTKPLSTHSPLSNRRAGPERVGCKPPQAEALASSHAEHHGGGGGGGRAAHAGHGGEGLESLGDAGEGGEDQ
jgi:hypothetical protein